MSAPTPEIKVTQEAAQALAAHLQEQGRGQQGLDHVAGRLVRTTLNNLGSARQGKDAEGPLLAIDVSEGFDNECLYAIVRPGSGGVRQIVKVVDEDTFGAFVTTGSWTKSAQGAAPQGKIPVPGDVELPTLSRPGGRPQEGDEPQRFDNVMMGTPDGKLPQQSAHPLPESETLVMWRAPNADGFEVKHQRCTFADVEEIVSKLVRDPSISNVEVWTSVKRPKLRIELG